MNNLDYYDSDEKKPKKKKSKKKKVKPPPPTRDFYDAQLTRLNRMLAALRARFKGKNTHNEELTNELVGIEDDRIEVCEHLGRIIKEQKQSIQNLHSTLTELTEECKAYKAWSNQRIIDLQRQYVTDRAQLETEIKLQKQALRTLDEFRIKRDRVLEQYESYTDDTEELKRKTNEDLFNMEQKAVIQKNMLKQEVEARLKLLVGDFLHSREIRNAGYTRSLIQENITLKKHLDKLVKQNIRLMEEREKQYLKTKEIMESYTSLEQLTNQLQRTIENKSNIVESLSNRTDRLRSRYIDARRYRRLYNLAKERGLFDKDEPKDFEEVIKSLADLTAEKNVIIQKQRVQESDLLEIRQTLNQLHTTVEKSIFALRQLGPGESLEPSERRATISELIFLAISDPAEDSNFNAIYRRGVCGLLLRESVTDDLTQVLFNRTLVQSKSSLKANESTCTDFDRAICLRQKDEWSSDEPERREKIFVIQTDEDRQFNEMRTTDFVNTKELTEKCFQSSKNLED